VRKSRLFGSVRASVGVRVHNFGTASNFSDPSQSRFLAADGSATNLRGTGRTGFAGKTESSTPASRQQTGQALLDALPAPASSRGRIFFLKSQRQADAHQPVEAAGDQLLTLVADGSLLVKQIAQVDDGLPLAGQESDARQILCEHHADVRVVGRHLSLERVNGEDRLRRRYAQHGRNFRAGGHKVRVDFHRDYLERGIAE